MPIKYLCDWCNVSMPYGMGEVTVVAIHRCGRNERQWNKLLCTTCHKELLRQAKRALDWTKEPTNA